MPFSRYEIYIPVLLFLLSSTSFASAEDGSGTIPDSVRDLGMAGQPGGTFDWQGTPVTVDSTPKTSLDAALLLSATGKTIKTRSEGSASQALPHPGSGLTGGDAPDKVRGSAGSYVARDSYDLTYIPEKDSDGRGTDFPETAGAYPLGGDENKSAKAKPVMLRLAGGDACVARAQSEYYVGREKFAADADGHQKTSQTRAGVEHLGPVRPQTLNQLDPGDSLSSPPINQGEIHTPASTIERDAVTAYGELGSDKGARYLNSAHPTNPLGPARVLHGDVVLQLVIQGDQITTHALSTRERVQEKNKIENSLIVVAFHDDAKNLQPYLDKTHPEDRGVFTDNALSREQIGSEENTRKPIAAHNELPPLADLSAGIALGQTGARAQHASIPESLDEVVAGDRDIRSSLQIGTRGSAHSDTASDSDLLAKGAPSPQKNQIQPNTAGAPPVGYSLSHPSLSWYEAYGASDKAKVGPHEPGYEAAGSTGSANAYRGDGPAVRDAAYKGSEPMPNPSIAYGSWTQTSWPPLSGKTSAIETGGNSGKEALHHNLENQVFPGTSGKMIVDRRSDSSNIAVGKLSAEKAHEANPAPDRPQLMAQYTKAADPNQIIHIKDEEERHTPFSGNPPPQSYFRATDATGTAKLPDRGEMGILGDKVTAGAELIAPIAMDEGLRFATREGGRTVGAEVTTPQNEIQKNHGSLATQDWKPADVVAGKEINGDRYNVPREGTASNLATKVHPEIAFKQVSVVGKLTTPSIGRPGTDSGINRDGVYTKKAGEDADKRIPAELEGVYSEEDLRRGFTEPASNPATAPTVVFDADSSSSQEIATGQNPSSDPLEALPAGQLRPGTAEVVRGSVRALREADVKLYAEARSEAQPGTGAYRPATSDSTYKPVFSSAISHGPGEQPAYQGYVAPPVAVGSFDSLPGTGGSNLTPSQMEATPRTSRDWADVGQQVDDRNGWPAANSSYPTDSKGSPRLDFSQDKILAPGGSAPWNTQKDTYPVKSQDHAIFPVAEQRFHVVDGLGDAVRVTLGPKGRNVVLDKSFGMPTITKDDVSTAKEIELSDKFENMGASHVGAATSNYNHEKLQERPAKLAGGIAGTYVGTSTEIEATEHRDRVVDALPTTRAAVEEGIVPGGGVTILDERAEQKGQAAPSLPEAPLQTLPDGASAQAEPSKPTAAYGILTNAALKATRPRAPQGLAEAGAAYTENDYGYADQAAVDRAATRNSFEQSRLSNPRAWVDPDPANQRVTGTSDLGRVGSLDDGSAKSEVPIVMPGDHYALQSPEGFGQTSSQLSKDPQGAPGPDGEDGQRRNQPDQTTPAFSDPDQTDYKLAQEEGTRWLEPGRTRLDEDLQDHPIRTSDRIAALNQATFRKSDGKVGLVKAIANAVHQKPEPGGLPESYAVSTSQFDEPTDATLNPGQQPTHTTPSQATNSALVLPPGRNQNWDSPSWNYTDRSQGDDFLADPPNSAALGQFSPDVQSYRTPSWVNASFSTAAFAAAEGTSQVPQHVGRGETSSDWESVDSRNVNVGTIGHVDHGKTTLLVPEDYARVSRAKEDAWSGPYGPSATPDQWQSLNNPKSPPDGVPLVGKANTSGPQGTPLPASEKATLHAPPPYAGPPVVADVRAPAGYSALIKGEAGPDNTGVNGKATDGAVGHPVLNYGDNPVKQNSGEQTRDIASRSAELMHEEALATGKTQATSQSKKAAALERFVGPSVSSSHS